jgi:hypothetical protein
MQRARQNISKKKDDNNKNDLRETEEVSVNCT